MIFSRSTPNLRQPATSPVARRSRGRCLFLFLVLLIAPAGQALAAEGAIVMAWDSNSDPTVAGYRIHYGTQSGVYSHTLDVGLTDQALIADLQVGVRYYFAMTAYSPLGLESGYSEELSGVPQLSEMPVGAVPARIGKVEADSTSEVRLDIEHGAAVAEILIYGSNDLSNWKVLGRHKAPFAEELDVQDPDASISPRRFYRMVSRFEAAP